MGSHRIEVLRQGLWASLSGGWFYDPHLSTFSNVFHLYLWLFFFLAPFTIHLSVPSSYRLVAWAIYSVIVTVAIACLKFASHKLHQLFDTSERYEAKGHNGSWDRCNSTSPTDNIELDEFAPSSASDVIGKRSGGRSKAPSPDVGAAGDTLNTTAVIVEVNPNPLKVTSLEDITSIEDITSLEDLKDDYSDRNKISELRKTIKAMSTQVTPQTSPLMLQKRRAMSQERWPSLRVPGVRSSMSTPPTLHRSQASSQSCRPLHRRNARSGRRMHRTNSVPDSPTGSHSHMLVGESRSEEQPQFTLEWSGYPHPSPRPRHKHRQMSLEEPLHGQHSRRYSLDLKHLRRTRSQRPSAASSTASSVVLLRSDSKREEDLKAIREKLLRMPIPERKIGTESEPVGVYTSDTRPVVTEEPLLSSDDSLSDDDVQAKAGITEIVVWQPTTSAVGRHVQQPQSNKNNSAKDSPLNTVPDYMDRPRNPTPTTASVANTEADPEPSTTEMVPSGSGIGARPKQTTKLVQGPPNKDEMIENVIVRTPSPSPVSSVSGSESTVLLTAKTSLSTPERGDKETAGAATALSSLQRVSARTRFRERSSLVPANSHGFRGGSIWGGRRRRHTSDSAVEFADPGPSGLQKEPEVEWHYYSDKSGCWYKYRFSNTPNEQPIKLGYDFVPPDQQATPTPNTEVTDLESPDLHLPTSARTGFSMEPEFPRILQIPELLEDLRFRPGSAQSRDNTSTLTLSLSRRESEIKSTKKFYRWNLCSRLTLKIWLDRLSLLSLLDRNITLWENCLSILLSLIVSVGAATLLSYEFFTDIWILFFCLVLAGCHYSLVKSVQPDAASPMHGYNNIIVYSRAFYFTLITILLIATDYYSGKPSTTFTIYGVTMGGRHLLINIRNILKIVMLCLPLVFTFGLLPQVTTFLQYFLEQMDIHVFGGNGTSSLLAAVYATVRSGIAVAILYGVALVPIKLSTDGHINSQITYSAFMGLLVALSYHLSRQSSDHTHLWMLIKSRWKRGRDQNQTSESEDVDIIKDPLPELICQSLLQRLRNDLIVCVLTAIFVFAIHASTVFSSPDMQPKLHQVLCYLATAVGLLLHYVMNQLRKEYPWLCCNHPILQTAERTQFNIAGPPVITWFEKLFVYTQFFEKSLLLPVVLISGITISTGPIYLKFGHMFGPLILVIAAIKSLRCMFSDTASQFCTLGLTLAAFQYDFQPIPEKDMFILNYALMLIFYSKFYDFFLKCKFIFQYIAPWQLAWGSAFHAFAQPLSVPHSMMLFIQAAVSTILYTPLNPLLGSAIFINSYMRPIKFWEKDYNTKRVDHSNIRLASQVENNLGADDNNLNSIFYEHLTRSLQKSLCGDLNIGRWGSVSQGDMFIMASDYLNALVHIIEMGNGLVTFQLRGLEFRGTYCQQREVEAITEGVEDNVGFCCCSPGHCPHFLSLNAAFGQRWLSWQVTVATYVLEGYSISDLNAATMLQLYDLRKVLVTYYMKSIIYFTIMNPKLCDWLSTGDESVMADINLDGDHWDAFCSELDEDYDRMKHAVTQNSFSRIYLPWIKHCVLQRSDQETNSKDDVSNVELNSDEINKQSPVVKLCYALSLVARRALATATHHNTLSPNVEFFLNGLHSLFKGDIRITGPDEWIFRDITFLRKVFSPSIRMSLKLLQEHFAMSDDLSNAATLFDSIKSYDSTLVITHEADPDWRNAVLSNRPHLLALRHVFDEGNEMYKIIMLNKRHLSFRIIKVNRECVRGLWAGQQQELVFLRNRNPERGSIQNAKQALRNMINSSCDQPIGYPIYVSPLTTSYSGTNEQFTSLVGGEISLGRVWTTFKWLWRRVQLYCGRNCRHFHSQPDMRELQYLSGGPSSSRSEDRSRASRSSHRPTPSKDGSLNTTQETSFTNSTSSAFAAASSLSYGKTVRISDLGGVVRDLYMKSKPELFWPSADIQKLSSPEAWGSIFPTAGQVQTGFIVHTWYPGSTNLKQRSPDDRVIHLVKFGLIYIPVTEESLTIGPFRPDKAELLSHKTL